MVGMSRSQSMHVTRHTAGEGHNIRYNQEKIWYEIFFLKPVFRQGFLWIIYKLMLIILSVRACTRPSPPRPPSPRTARWGSTPSWTPASAWARERPGQPSTRTRSADYILSFKPSKWVTVGFLWLQVESWKCWPATHVCRSLAKFMWLSVPYFPGQSRGSLITPTILTRERCFTVFEAKITIIIIEILVRYVWGQAIVSLFIKDPCC